MNLPNDKLLVPNCRGTWLEFRHLSATEKEIIASTVRPIIVEFDYDQTRILFECLEKHWYEQYNNHLIGIVASKGVGFPNHYQKRYNPKAVSEFMETDSFLVAEEIEMSIDLDPKTFIFIKMKWGSKGI